MELENYFGALDGIGASVWALVWSLKPELPACTLSCLVVIYKAWRWRVYQGEGLDLDQVPEVVSDLDLLEKVV